MFHRLFRCILLSFLLVAATPMLWAQDCPDTQPTITGADIACDQNASLVNYVYSTPATTGTPTHSYQWVVTPVAGRTIVGATNQNQLQVKWLSVGTYTIQLTEWNNDPTFTGCVGKVTSKTITVQPLLHAYFYYEFDPTGGCYYNIVNFTGNVSVSADPSVTYSWNFGDGSPVVTGIGVAYGVLQHTFPTTAGVTYTVVLTVTNSAGQSDMITDYVYVNPDLFKPVATFTNTAQPQPNNCLYNPIAFDASASLPKPVTNPDPNIHIRYYEWDFDDPSSGSSNIVNTGTVPTVSHVFSTFGVHHVKVTVVNTPYCTSTFTKDITIDNTVPSASFTNTVACIGSPSFFTNTSVTPVGTITQLEWIYGDGTSYVSTNPAELISHQYLALGTYSAKLRVTNSNNCVSEYFIKPVSVNPGPMASFLVGNACLGEAVAFTNTSTLNGGTQITNFLWNFGDPLSGSNSSPDPNPTHMFSALGSYSVSLAVTNTDGCINTYTISPPLVVNPKPVVDFTYQNGTQNWEILFNETIISGNVGNNLVWDYGDGTHGYGVNPSHVYQGPGNFQVTLTATDYVNGCSNSIQKQIIILGTQSAFFTTDSPKCVADTMHFTPQVPGGNIVKEVWDFGDGVVVTYLPPLAFPIFATHPYTAAGTYTVTRTVTYITNFFESFSIQVVVYPLPTANFTFSNNAAFPNTYACADQAVFFTDLSFSTSGNIIDWFWDFKDPGSGINQTSVLQNPSHVFTNSNTHYHVLLRVTDNVNNCTDTLSKDVWIHAPVPVDYTMTQNSCLDQVVNFNANLVVMTPANIATWDWDFGDATAHSGNPISAAHLYGAAGTYTSRLTVTDLNGCTNSITKTVNIMPQPVPGFSFASPTCDGLPVQFTDQSYVPAGFPGYDSTWVWTWGDGTSTTIHLPASANVTHIFPTGVYSFPVRLTVTSNYGCKDSIVHVVNLIPSPTAAFEVLPGTATCATQVVQFHDLSQTNGGGNIVGWLWDFRDPGSGLNNTSTSPSPSHTFALDGTYNVILKVTNANGCYSYDTIPIVINKLPVADFTATTTCAGSSTQFTDNSTANAAAITSYSWTFGDGGTSTLQSPLHTYATYGIYNVTLNIINLNGCMSTVTKQVTVHPNPVAQFTFSPSGCIGNPVTFTDMSFIPAGFSGYVNKWVWDFGDGSARQTINFPTSPDVTYTFAGTATSHVVKLIVTTTTGCTDSITKTVNSIPSPIANFSYSNTTCLGQIVAFTDLSQTNGGGSIQTWNWNFGDPLSGANNTSTLQNPNHSFTAAGTFTVVLNIMSTNGCTRADTVQVTINSLPVANFTNTTACENNSTVFTDASTANAPSIISYDWNFGDGGTSNLQSPVHTYASYGTYTVTLTIVNSNGCIHSISKQVVVYPKPVPDFTYSPASCIGNPVTFTNQSFVPSGFSSYINQWVWDFGDGTALVTVNFPGNPNMTHTFAGTAISHIVKLKVTTTNGCVDSISKTVTSIPSPIANFTYSTTTCLGQLVNFTDLSQTNGGGSIQNWAWSFSDPVSGASNNSTLQNPSHAFTSAGSFLVTLTITSSNGCVNTYSTTVVINALPAANFTNTAACAGTATIFTNTSTTPGGTSIVSDSWDFGDGQSSNLQSPTHTYGSFGTYSVTLTVVNSNGCIHTITKLVLVNPLPVPDFTYSPASCVGNPVNFYNQSFVPTGFSSYIDQWIWDFSDGSALVTINFPGNPNITHTFAGTAVSHAVKLKVRTTNGCIDSITKTVTSIPSPIANFSYSNTTCIGQSVLFTDLSQTNGGGIIQTWAWNFSDPLSGASNNSTLQNPSHSFTTVGSFVVTLTITSSNGCVNTYSTTVTVNALPTANFTFSSACEGSPTTFTDGSSTPGATTIVSYAWNFGDGGTSTAQSPQHNYATYGNFSVTLTVTNSNGCIHTVTKQVLVNPKPISDFSFSPASCVGTPVNFYNQAYVPTGYSASIQTWVWDFGDGQNATITFPANPSVTHTFVGNSTSHTVTLTVTTTTGCIGVVSKVVTSVPRPIVNFSYSSTLCDNQPVQFTDLSQTNGGGSIQTWNWNFGDAASGMNNTATVQNPIHQFSAARPPSYAVRLIVTNGNGCKDTLIQTIAINARPTSNFKADTVCQGSMTTFTDQSSASAVAHLWDFGDGITSTGISPTHLYATANTYTVKLTVTTALGCMKDTTKQVLVLGKPVSSFSFSSPNCAGDSVQFNDLSTTPHGYIKKWEWDFGDGTPVITVNFPASQNVRHKFTNGGNYSVKLTITTSDNCTNEKVNLVQVGFHPIANFSTGPTPCAGISLQFTDLSQTNGGPAITIWHWNFGDPASGVNNTSTTQNPTHAFTVGGPFIVRLVVTNANGCLDSIVGGKTITVNPAPAAIFSADTACMASPTQFTDASTTASGTIVSWDWDFGDPSSGANNTSTLPNPTHIYNTQGTYNVKLTVTNSHQCTKDTTLQINVNPKPTAMFQYDPACINAGTQFTDLSTVPGSSIQSWLWDFGDGTPPATIKNPIHVFTTSGTFQVKLTVKNLFNCSDSVTIPVISRPKPVSAFSYLSFNCPKGKVDFQDQSTATGSAITTREWIFTPGYTSNIQNPSFTFPVTDTTYLVTLIVTDTYGCIDTIVDSVHVKPGFRFTFTHDTVCQGYPTHFYPVNKALGDSLYSVSWNFGDPASGPNNKSYLYRPSHIFTGPGIYAVRMKAYNSDNCADSVYQEIQVYAAPKPLYRFVSTPCDSSVHVFDSTQYSGSGSIASWLWNWGDGTSTTILAPGPGDTAHLYVTPGVYPVQLVITNTHGCIDSITRSVRRFACIQAVYTNKDTLCARYKIAFADSSLPVSKITQWHWTWGDGKDTTYSKHKTPIYHTFSDTGTYHVNLAIQALIDGATIVDSMSTSVKIHPTPKTYFSNVPTCLKQISLFRDTSKTWGEKNITWNWTFSPKANDTALRKNPSHMFDTAGIYNVKLVVMNKYGCKDSLTKPTRVFGLPAAHFENTTACKGDPTFFTDKSLVSDTTIAKWRWFFGDPTTLRDSATIKDPSYKYDTTGLWTVRMIVKDHYGCIDTVDSAVRVNITPVSSFTIVNGYDGKQGQVKLNNLTGGTNTYNWEFGNGKASTETNPVATFTEDGSYVIKLISHNEFDCTDTTFYEYKLLFKGLFVPNAFAPASTSLGIRLFQPIGVNLKQYHVTVFDNWGHLMWESTKLDDKGVPTEGWDGTFEGNLMPQGNYMWRINALFVDESPWNGSDNGGANSGKTMGTVTLIR